jgi:hypothetical protein
MVTSSILRYVAHSQSFRGARTCRCALIGVNACMYDCLRCESKKINV